jgi:hypothetical protein
MKKRSNMKSTVLKTFLIILFSVCIYDSLPAEETYAAETVPSSIAGSHVNPGNTVDHHRRRHRRRIRRRIIRRHWHPRRHF